MSHVWLETWTQDQIQGDLMVRLSLLARAAIGVGFVLIMLGLYSVYVISNVPLRLGTLKTNERGRRKPLRRPIRSRPSAWGGERHEANR